MTYPRTLSIQMVTLLVQHGADVNEMDDDGFSPLHLACGANSRPLSTVTAILLVQLGADVKLKSKALLFKYTPLEYVSDKYFRTKLNDLASCVSADNVNQSRIDSIRAAGAAAGGRMSARGTSEWRSSAPANIVLPPIADSSIPLPNPPLLYGELYQKGRRTGDVASTELVLCKYCVSANLELLVLSYY